MDVAQLLRSANGDHAAMGQPLHSTLASSEIRDLYGVIESEKIRFRIQDVVLIV